MTRAATLAEPAAPARSRHVRRVLVTVALSTVTLWAVVTLVFLLPRLIPGDPLNALQDPSNGTFVDDPAIRARVAAYYGLDRPLVVQYGRYLAGLLTGDLGWSISQNSPVGDLVAARLPWTLLLTGCALALSSVVGFAAGVHAAWHRGRVGDRILVGGLSAVRAIPEYALAAFLLVTLAVVVPVFPQAGARTPFAEYPSAGAAVGDVLAHLTLPLLALTAGLTGNKFLLVRNTVVGTLGADFMVLARAKGLPPRLLRYRHSGRNALLPFLTALGVQAGFAVGGSLFVETVFAYPGMGSLVGAAVTARDYPLLQGTFLVLAVVVLAANLLVELAYGLVDPRVTR